jgi:hypothetical protein
VLLMEMKLLKLLKEKKLLKKQMLMKVMITGLMKDIVTNK